MDVSGSSNHEQNLDAAGEIGQREASGRPADPKELAEAIRVLEDQIAVLEEGLPQAPGMERAALAKEIAMYRQELDSKQSALRRLRGDGAAL